MLFVANKPPQISSNAFLSRLKKNFNNKNLGFSGTLDPFASGTLVVASDKHMRLFNHFNLSPKVYIATLWLGVKSPTLDIEAISYVSEIDELDINHIKATLMALRGKLTYIPPKFSAKKIKGIRAYNLARENIDFSLTPCEMEIFDIELLFYNHPFLSFKVSVSKGAYIRSLGEIIADKLGTIGVLSVLKRIREGNFIFESYKMLNVLDFLPYQQLRIPHLKYDFMNGKKINIKDLQGAIEVHKFTSPSINISTNSKKSAIFNRYIVIFDDFFSIIQVDFYGRVEYILNRIDLC